jgi:prepilin-type N-terminal cleavage/methylation domain-containing protein
VKPRRGFTLIELLVVIAIIGLLASVVMASLNSARAKARDVRRLSDMQTIQKALELYYDKYGRYPDSDFAGCGTWDTPGNGTFLAPLVTEGFLPANIQDPTSNTDCGNYRYYRYDAGTNTCPFERGGYYVLSIVDLETAGRQHSSSPDFGGVGTWTSWDGTPRTRDGICPGRWWGYDVDWVIGKFEK